MEPKKAKGKKKSVYRLTLEGTIAREVARELKPVSQALEERARATRAKASKFEQERRAFAEERWEFRKEMMRLKNQAINLDSPLVAVNGLIVEALFLLDRRYESLAPRYYGLIRDLLCELERATAVSMTEKARVEIYGKELTNDEIDAIYAKFKNLQAGRALKKFNDGNGKDRVPTDDELDRVIGEIEKGDEVLVN